VVIVVDIRFLLVVVTAVVELVLDEEQEAVVVVTTSSWEGAGPIANGTASDADRQMIPSESKVSSTSTTRDGMIDGIQYVR
jgi:hypothetical protein